jgi:hypothetical protein
VSGAVPGSDWEYTGDLGSFTLPAAGGSDTFNNLTTGSYTITETPKPGYTVTPSDSVTLTFDEPCGQHFDYTFTNTCTGTIKIIKVVSGAVPLTDWEFASDIPGHLSFTLPAAGGNVTFSSLAAGSYTVTETEKPGYAVTPNNPKTLTLPACQDIEYTFTNACTGSIKIIKVVSGAVPATDWEFASDIPGHLSFTLPAAGGNVTFTGIPGPTADYTVTETPKAGYAVTPSASQTLTLPACGNIEFTFTNTYGEGCKWCTKSAVLSQVEQNVGFCCAVPDILVDLRLGITPVDPAKVALGEPATGSLQAAVDYINANGDINGDGYLFIGVTAQDCGTGTVGGTGLCAGISGRGPYGDGTENVTITNTHTERLNIFGCSVTLTAADPTKPVITITGSTGKVTVLDIHVTGSLVAGYKVQNNADLVVVKNSRAKDTTIGYDILPPGGKVEITGSPEISGNTTAGILVAGSNVTLRTNSDIINNGIGIKITGDNNETNGNEVGTNGHPNVTGILVTGKGNSLAGDNVSYNTGDGIVIAGSGTSLANGNKIEDEDAGYNGDDGIVVSGNYNTVLKNKQVKFNKGDGIEVSGNYNSLQENVTESNGGNGINVSGNNNTLKKNQSKSNTLAGILISGNSNILDQNTGVEKNLQRGFYIMGSLNKLTKNEAKNNTGYEFTIAANNNVGSSGNKANGTAFTIPLAGGNFGTP